MAAAWCWHGLRTPVRKVLLAGSVTPETYRRAFGFRRTMYSLGTIVGLATVPLLPPWVGHQYLTLSALTLIRVCWRWRADKTRVSLTANSCQSSFDMTRNVVQNHGYENETDL